MRLAVSLITLGACYALAAASTTVPSVLKCRVCNNAKNLGDCTTDVRCDANEDCYMESVITDQLDIIYNGGCRATDVCQSTTSGLFGKRNADDKIHIAKREGLVACSKCCDSSVGCNTKLCGIENKLINASLCYFCDHSLSTQSEVEHPADCSTHTVCQHDEFCYAGKFNTAGVESFKYGCMKKMICRALTTAVFEEFDRCYNSTDTGKCGGALHNNRAPVPLCHACCGYGECNYGSCYDINERNYLYNKKGLWDKDELKPMTGVTTTVLPKTTPATTTPTTTTTSATTTPTTTLPSPTKTTTSISSPTPPPTTQPQPPTTSTQPPPTTTTTIVTTTTTIATTSKAAPITAVAPSPASAQPANTPTGANSSSSSPNVVG